MTQSLAQALQAFSPGLPLVVAFSGGADSTALLAACVQRWPGQVRAVHVHHGLQPAADDFQKHCEAFCERWQVPLLVQGIDARPLPGQSPEDAARKGRYDALIRAVQTHWPQVRDIALAQHADDQIETLLLALSRGSGLPGLAAMPMHWERQGLQWHRPFLQVPGAELRAWLLEQGLAWVEDPSNQDERYTRNRIRKRLLPALQEVFPSFRDTFARSARHAAQAQDLLQAQAQADLQALGSPPSIAGLQALSVSRQGAVLRHWLYTEHDTQASSAQLQELQRQIKACTTRGHRLAIRVGAGFVVREGAHLAWAGEAKNDPDT
jgi:tRNA(Ile)-lysidine synthase